MLILLPPSETKRPGGTGAPWRVDGLALPELGEQRARTIDALVALAADEDRAARVLKLSVRQRSDIAANAALLSAPTMPAVDRYTGVLYDALDAASLDPSARRWLGAHVLIHSAPFGPVSALDPIPLYRLGASTSLPGIPPLRRVWADAVGSALRSRAPGFVLDLRSEAYQALGPIPDDVPSTYVRVVSEGPDGVVRALNHFNKHVKGLLVRELAEKRPRVTTLDGLRRWLTGRGHRIEPVGDEWRLSTGTH
jgi:cytoplasmic iron level regulating protein YaaA (DUF328/UPF0246 family)